MWLEHILGDLPTGKIHDQNDVNCVNAVSSSPISGNDFNSSMLSQNLYESNNLDVKKNAGSFGNLVLQSNDAGLIKQDVMKQKGVCGLNNLGNTCFMNSGLQCLTNCASIVHYFTSVYKHDEKLSDELSYHFCNLLKIIWSGSYCEVRPEKLKATIASHYHQYSDYRQHDCQEFLALFLDALHEEINKSGNFCLYDSLDGPNSAEAFDQATNIKTDPTYSCEPGTSCLSSYSKLCESSSGENCSSHQTSSLFCPKALNLNDFGIDSDVKQHLPSGSSNYSIPECSPEPPNNIRYSMKEKSTTNFQISSNDIGNKRVPSAVEFYMKDTKTSNANVLASEFIPCVGPLIDSEKFHKPDNTSRLQDNYEQITEFLLNEMKGSPNKLIKDTNLLANQHTKADTYSQKLLLNNVAIQDKDNFEHLKNPSCTLNNVKRIKIDEEKNKKAEASFKMKFDDSHSLFCPDVKHNENNAENILETVSRFSSNYDMQHQSAADKAWNDHLLRNSSPIVETFQGQFKSTVICDECKNVSVTFEPFMYLPVPLPHAMDRQISVTYMSLERKPPTCYLLNLHKQDNVMKLKEALWKILGIERNEMIVAEVFDSHISRTLEDVTLLKYVNDVNRSIYVFEMKAPVNLELYADYEKLNNKSMDCQDDKCMELENIVSVENMSSSTSSIQMFDENQNNKKLTPCESKSLTFQIHNDLANKADVMFSGDFVSESNISSSDTNTFITHTSYCPDENFQDNFISSVHDSLGGNDNTAIVMDEWQKCDSNDNTVMDEWQKCTSNDNTVMGEWQKCASNDNTVIVMDEWRKCAICLEELSDLDLIQHNDCGGTLCRSCLEMSFKHYGAESFICPVCSVSANPENDFSPINAASNYTPKTRTLAVPIIFRILDDSDDTHSYKTFGHPDILFLYSYMPGTALYDEVYKILPIALTNYQISITDGQGLRCSRCLYNQKCSGCNLMRNDQITLNPGDNLSVTFPDMSIGMLNESGLTMMDKTMDGLRSKEKLHIYDCLDSFMDSEMLDEHNPAYCTQCKKNCISQKSLSVWRYPKTLIIYLKRFVFHDGTSSKIDCDVVFPLEDLNLTDYISGPYQDSEMMYDLQSIVCHFGGIAFGHYTTYAKHPWTNEWFYYNDEKVSAIAPKDDDFKSAYILFYHQQNSNKELEFHLEEDSIDISSVMKVHNDLYLNEPSPFSPTRKYEMAKLQHASLEDLSTQSTSLDLLDEDEISSRGKLSKTISSPSLCPKMWSDDQDNDNEMDVQDILKTPCHMTNQDDTVILNYNTSKDGTNSDSLFDFYT